MALGSILQLIDEVEEKQNTSLIQPVVLEEPVVKPPSSIFQLLDKVEEEEYQKEIGPVTFSNSIFETDAVKYKSFLADIDQTIPSVIKGVQYGTVSMPQAIGGLMRQWAETRYLMANPSEYVGDPKWEGADEKMFEAMYTSKYKPVRDIQTGVGKDVDKKAQEMIKVNREYANKFLPPEDASALNKFLFDLGAGATSIALSVGISLATHNPLIGASVFGGIAAGQTYQEAREAGVEPLKASALSSINFAAQTALEYAGLEFLLTRLPVAKGISMIMKGTSEGMQEFLQEVSSNLVAKYGWDTTRKWNQGALRAAALGFILGDATDVVINSFVRETKAPYNETKKIVDRVYEDMKGVTKNVDMESISNVIEDERMDYGGELPMSSEEPGGTTYVEEQESKVIPQGEKYQGKAYRAETDIAAHGAEVIGKMKTAKEKLDYDYGTTGNVRFKDAEKTAVGLGIDLSKVPNSEMAWVSSDLKTAEKYGEAREYKFPEDTIVLARDTEGGSLILKNSNKYIKPMPVEDVVVFKKAKIEGLAEEVDPAIEALQRVGNAHSRLNRNKIILEAERLGDGTRATSMRIEKELEVTAKADKIKAQNDLYEALEPKYHIGDVVEIEAKGLMKKRKVKIENAVFKTGISAQQMMQTGFPASFAFDNLTGTDVVTGEKNVPIYPSFLVNGEILSTTIKRKSEDVLKQMRDAKPTTGKVEGAVTFAGEGVEGVGTVVTEPTGRAVGKAIPAKRITAGKRPGILVTLKEYEQTVHNNKIGELVYAMGDKKVSSKVTNQVKKEYNDFWSRGISMAQTYVANNRLIENVLGMMDNFKTYGPNWQALYSGVNDGMTKVIAGSNRAVEDLRSFLHPLYTDKQMSKLITDRAHAISGAKFTLTDGAVAGVYMSARNKNNLRHLKGMGFTKADIKQCTDIVNSNPNLKAIVTYLDMQYEAAYKRLADAVMKAEGRVLDKEAFFSHIAIDKETIVFEEDNIAEQMRTRSKVLPTPYVEKGITKKRTHSSRPMHLDAIANYLRYSADAEFYIGMASPIADANKILKDKKYRAAIEQKMDKATLQVLDKYLRDVAGTKTGINIDGVDRAFSYLRRHAGTAMIGMNILSAMRQPLSLSQAAAEIGLSHVLRGMQQVISNPIAVMKMVYENSTPTKYRAGQFERFITEEKAAERVPQVLTGKKTPAQIFMSLVSFMDKWTVISVWKGTYDRVIATGETMDGQRIPNVSLHEAAVMEADRVIRHTQPFTGAKDLPGYHRGNVLSLVLTQFQNQVNKNLNYYDYDIVGKYRAGKIGAGTAAYRALFAYVLPAMMLGMVARGRLPRKPKDIAEDLIKYPLAGAFLVGSLVNNAIDNYGDWGVPATQGIVDAGKTLAALSDFEWERGGKYGIKATAEILGLPYSQVYRTYTGLKALMEGRTEDWKRIIWSEYVLNRDKPAGSRVGRPGKAARSAR